LNIKKGGRQTMAEIIYTEVIRINGTPFLNPCESLEKLEKWLWESKERFRHISWKVEEWKGRKELCIVDTLEI